MWSGLLNRCLHREKETFVQSTNRVVRSKFVLFILRIVQSLNALEILGNKDDCRDTSHILQKYPCKYEKGVLRNVQENHWYNIYRHG